LENLVNRRKPGLRSLISQLDERWLILEVFHQVVISVLIIILFEHLIKPIDHFLILQDLNRRCLVLKQLRNLKSKAIVFFAFFKFLQLVLQNISLHGITRVILKFQDNIISILEHRRRYLILTDFSILICKQRCKKLLWLVGIQRVNFLGYIELESILVVEQKNLSVL